MSVEYRVKMGEKVALVEFTIQGGVLDVGKLGEVVELAPPVPGTKVVCLSGRGPVWLYAALTHRYHYARAVAVYEPRLDKFVVVATHAPDLRVGDLVSFE